MFMLLLELVRVGLVCCVCGEREREREREES